MAWINSTPEKATKSRYAQFVDGLGVEPDMPKISFGDYLVDYLLRIGAGIANGMGYVGITYTEIQAWAQLSKIPLTGWESETLHKMSQAYCGQLSISSKRDCLAPWSKLSERNIEANRDKIAKGTLEAFERAASKPKSKPAKKRAR